MRRYGGAHRSIVRSASTRALGHLCGSYLRLPPSGSTLFAPGKDMVQQTPREGSLDVHSWKCRVTGDTKGRVHARGIAWQGFSGGAAHVLIHAGVRNDSQGGEEEGGGSEVTLAIFLSLIRPSLGGRPSMRAAPAFLRRGMTAAGSGPPAPGHHPIANRSSSSTWMNRSTHGEEHGGPPT